MHVAQGAQEPKNMFLYFRSGSEISDTGFSLSGQYSRRRETHPESQLPGISYFCDEAFLLSCQDRKKIYYDQILLCIGTFIL